MGLRQVVDKDGRPLLAFDDMILSLKELCWGSDVILQTKKCWQTEYTNYADELSKSSSKVLTKEPSFALLVLEVYAYIHHQIHLWALQEKRVVQGYVKPWGQLVRGNLC